MNDKAKYWLRLCDEDVKSIKVNLKGKRYLLVGFLCHLIAEKSLKAVIAERTNEIPPKIHNLVRLSELAGLANDLSVSQIDLLARLSRMHIDGRYAEYKESIRKTLSPEICKTLVAETEAFLCWIKNKLGI